MHASRIVMFALVATTACARGQIGIRPAVTAGDAAAQVIVARNRNPIGAANSNEVTVDGTKVLAIRVGEYARLTLDPGNHTLGVRCFGGWIPMWNEDRIDVSLAPKAVKYFLISPSGGLACSEIEPVDERAGEEYVRGGTEIPIR